MIRLLKESLDLQNVVLEKVHSIKFFLLVKRIIFVWKTIIKILEKNEFKPKIRNALKQLINMINKWRTDMLKMKHYDLLKLVLDESGYSSMLKKQKI